VIQSRARRLERLRACARATRVLGGGAHRVLRAGSRVRVERSQHNAQIRLIAARVSLGQRDRVGRLCESVR
jgi:hypothetical protein